MKTFFIFLLVAFINLYPQSPDSLSTDLSKRILDSLATASHDTTAVPDTTGLLSTKKIKAKADTLVPLHTTPLFNVSDFISRQEYLMNDYRYTANIIQNSSAAAFLADRGFIGQPNELYLYGIGNSGISYFDDGILINNRISNQYDLNNFMSEQVDSVEMIPLPRGFLYGPFNNPVSVNLITKDLINVRPYTKVKYYQGADGEAFIDAMFNSIVFKKFLLTVDISNRKYDSSYVNSDYSLWQGRFKLKYLLSNKINLSGDYSIVDSKLGMNNGVDVDSILKTTSDFTTIFYDNLTAPVLSPFLRQNVKQHNFRLGMLGKFLDSSPTKLDFYYMFGLNELDFTSNHLIFQNKDYTYGVNLEQNYNKDFVNVKLLVNYEKTIMQRLDYYSNEEYDFKNNSTYFSISPIITFSLLNKKLLPSIFYKHTNYSFDVPNDFSQIKNQDGFGLDISYCLNNDYSFYAGYSTYNSIYNLNFSSAEIGVKINYSYLNLNLDAFNRKMSIDVYNFLGSPRTDADIYIYRPMNGVNLKANLDIKPLLLETQTSYCYNYKNTSELLNLFPKVNFEGGIYYKNILFKENLNLKTGFKFYYNSEMGCESFIFTSIPSSLHVDFTLVGEIQKVAYVYFTWENILGKQYYLVPYYPMRGRNLHFGVSWELFN